MSRQTVQVQIAGREYAVRTDEDEEWLQHVAGLVDEKMVQIRDRTGMVDSFDIAMLACLNLAKELHEHRANASDSTTEVGDDELKSLIDMAESALARLPELVSDGVGGPQLLPMAGVSRDDSAQGAPGARAPHDGGV